MYQALYRKYRPRCFGDVTGQDHITETLRRQIINDRLSHAYLFVGTRGTGKTTCAKILSRAVNCLNIIDGEPCNKCISCIGIEDGSILDVLELDAASNNSVDNVRALRDEAIYSPAAVKKRVYIIDEVHMLSLSAFNALLKILEEPPEHILFILATTELHKVPATIQGRCQKYSFKRLSPRVIAERLDLISSMEGLKITSDAVERLSLLADGSMRDGISLLDQCAYDDVIDLARILDTLGLAGQQELLSLAASIINRDVLTALDILDGLYNDGRDMASLLNEITSLLRDLLIYKLSPGSGLLSNTGLTSNDLSSLSAGISDKSLFSYLDILKEAISGVQRSGSSKLTVEMSLIKMCGSVGSAKDSDSAVSNADVTENTNRAASVVLSEVLTPAVNAVDMAFFDDTKESVSFWTGVLDSLRNEPSVHALLSDSSKVQASLQDNILNISVPDLFTANLVETDFAVLIKDTVKKTVNKDVMLQVEINNKIESSPNNTGLDSLNAFDIVNFE